MPVPGIISRAGAALVRPFRGIPKQLGHSLPFTGGVVPSDWPLNFWQTGRDPLTSGGSAVVYACQNAYSQTIAMCPPTHWESDGKGGRERYTTSALCRVLRKPNSYQSTADFFLYLTDCLYGEGEAFGLALRNARFEITEIHLMDPRLCYPRISTTGELFYYMSGSEIVERKFAGNLDLLSAVPARDVLHVRLPDKRNPLIGVPPLQAALMEVAASNSMIAQALAYASNQGRPSGVIETDLKLDREAVAEVRRMWNAQTAGANQGGTPILTAGLKWSSAIVTSRDQQLAEFLQISDQRVATAYRVPLALLSLQSAAGPQGSTESLMAFWVSTGLGFAANLIEDAIGRLFQLAGWPDDYVELDLEALLRANFKDRVEALARGVQGGIYSPNEARAKEDLPAMPFGDEPRVQQQVVPLSAWAQAPPATPAPDAPPSSPPASGPEGDSTDDGQPGEKQQEQWIGQIIHAADRFDAKRHIT